ncbi:MAG TPA: TMEM165/GDT1 family protein [Phycisphaerae bacterium]|nr:TMEM165/GDT1 family protein [Phycisphaerae bacterium]
MSLKTVLATFAIVFLAELGDKTQLSVLLFTKP